MAEIEITVQNAQVQAALARLAQALGGSISVSWGTNVLYGAIQHFGGRAGKGHRARIPARPYLGVSDDDRTELLTIVNDHLSRTWGGERLTGADVARAMGRYLKTSTQLRFRDQEDPEGRPWRPSQRVALHGGQTLRLSGRLRNSITYVVQY